MTSDLFFTPVRGGGGVGRGKRRASGCSAANKSYLVLDRAVQTILTPPTLCLSPPVSMETSLPSRPRLVVMKCIPTPARPRPDPGPTPARPRPDPGPTPARPRPDPAATSVAPGLIEMCVLEGAIRPSIGLNGGPLADTVTCRPSVLEDLVQRGCAPGPGPIGLSISPHRSLLPCCLQLLTPGPALGSTGRKVNQRQPRVLIVKRPILPLPDTVPIDTSLLSPATWAVSGSRSIDLGSIRPGSVGA
ncbi:unnamed protein product [Gadus morhua 'NCC']